MVARSARDRGAGFRDRQLGGGFRRDLSDRADFLARSAIRRMSDRHGKSTVLPRTAALRGPEGLL